jgi:AcrR family transcriptional regulator
MIESGIDTKEQILNTATVLFARKGYKGTSVRDIARETGINLSMISYYFQGKQGIMKAILQNVVDDFNELIVEELPLEDNVELLAQLEKLLTFLSEHSNEIIILLDRFNRNIEELDLVFPVIEKQMKTIIRYLSEVGGLPQEESTEGALLLVEMWGGMIFSDHLLNLTEVMGEEIASSKAELNKKRQKILLLITEFILQHKTDLLKKMNEK